MLKVDMIKEPIGNQALLIQHYLRCDCSILDMLELIRIKKRALYSEEIPIINESKKILGVITYQQVCEALQEIL